MRVVADSHSLLYYLFTPDQLSDAALDALGTAEDTDGIVVSAATLGDLWYSSHKIGKRALTPGAFDLLSSTVLDTSNTGFDVVPVDVATMLELTSFPLEPLRDPWDRMIVSTAKSSTAYPSYLPTGPSQPSEQSTSSGNPGMTESEICSTPANLELNDRLIVSMVA